MSNPDQYVVKESQEELQEESLLPQFLTEDEVMGFLGVNTQQIRELRVNHELPFIKINTRKRLYLESSLATWLVSKEIIQKQDV